MRTQWTGFQSVLAGDIEAFLTHHRALGKRFKTEEAALRLLDRYLVEQHLTHLVAITPSFLETFLTSRPRAQPRSYNHLLSVLRRLFDWLVKQERLMASPLRARPRRATGQRRPFIFDTLQARRLLEVAARLPDWPRTRQRGPTYRTIFALLYGLGLRVGEVTRLRWSDVDFERQLLIIRQTKFLKSRLVPFGPRMGEALACHLRRHEKLYGTLRPGDPVFSFGNDPSKPLNPDSVSLLFHYLVPQLDLTVPPGVSSPRLHDLRHSFAVGTLLRWYQAGINPAQRLFCLSTFMGHVHPASTAVYLTITTELLEQANQRFARFAVPLSGELEP